MPAELVTIDASESLDKINEIIARDGGVIVRNFLSLQETADFMKAIEPHFKSRTIYKSRSSDSEYGADFFPYGSIRVYGLLSKTTDQLVNVLQKKVWTGIMERFLSDEYFSFTGENLFPQKSSYIMGTSGAFRLVPGANSQPLHRDQITYQIREDPKNPLFTPKVGCLIAGSRSTKANGATAVIPGSHLWPHDRYPKLEECTYAEMEPGSALFTLGSTYHAAGKNVCTPEDPDALRTLFAVFGQRDYYRQDQEERLMTPVEVARKLPKEILRLAAYYKALGGTGYIEDHEDVADYLFSGRLQMGPSPQMLRSV